MFDANKELYMIDKNKLAKDVLFIKAEIERYCYYTVFYSVDIEDDNKCVLKFTMIGMESSITIDENYDIDIILYKVLGDLADKLRNRKKLKGKH